MKENEVRRKAFAMPLTNPAYPIGPYRFYNREYLIITYRTNLENGRGGDCIVLGDFRIECTDGTIDHCQPWLVHGLVGAIFPSKDVQP